MLTYKRRTQYKQQITYQPAQKRALHQRKVALHTLHVSTKSTHNST